MDKKDFKMLMYALYGNKQLIIPDGQTLHQWIDNAFIEKKEQLHIPDVSQQRELLIEAFDLINIHDGDREKITKLVDITLKSINCG
jgi:hypothetical protein